MGYRVEQRVRGYSLAPRHRKRAVEPELLLSSTLGVFPGEGKRFVHVLDGDGSISAREVGVRWINFALLSVFYTMRSQPWPLLVAYSLLLYVGILFVFSAAYMSWARACGAEEGSSWVAALYFTVVSFAANGGYVGEQPTTMLDPQHTCFSGRTLLVTLLSYGNIIFVGLVASLFVSKAACGEELSQRIVFSDFCSLTAAPGREDNDCWELTFRMANSSASKALTDGRLRLFVVFLAPPSGSLAKRKRRRRKSSPNKKAHESGVGAGGDPCVAGDGTSKRRGRTLKSVGRGCPRHHHERHKGFHEVESALASEESRRLLGESLWKDPFDALESRGADPTPLDAEVESYIVEVLTEEQLKLGAQQQKGREGAADKNIPPSTVTSSSGSFVDSKASSGGTSRVVGSPSCSQSPTKREGSSSSEVSIRVEELSWSCSEEKHTNGQDGRLLLWFPVNITHTINRYSPLYRYMKNNALCHTAAPPGTSQLESCSTASPKGKGNSDSGTVCPFNFQLVVMFDASETDIGRSLTARHTYSAEEIIKHYRFSNKVIRVAPDKSEIVVDYHYFNEMVPDSLSSPHRVH